LDVGYYFTYRSSDTFTSVPSAADWRKGKSCQQL